MARDERPPYFPFYPLDFVGDGLVEMMSAEEIGCYMLLLCKAWHQTPPASVPNDDEVLARWSRVTPERWQEIKAKVLGPWKLRGDRWHQKRLKTEYTKFSDRSAKLSEAGKRGLAKRWGSNRQAIAEPLPARSNADPEPDNNPPSPASGGDGEASEGGKRETRKARAEREAAELEAAAQAALRAFTAKPPDERRAVWAQLVPPGSTAFPLEPKSMSTVEDAARKSKRFRELLGVNT
jgi:uncharacterized protein YdaU (DUF1376 family)